MKIKVSDYIVKRLSEEGVRTIFGYQGGNISHLIDSIGRDNAVSFVETYNEQGAAFAANAYSIINETLGVAIASSGPGAINLLNGVANAWCDSIPCIFLCGDVNTTAKQPDSKSRQDAFQQIDIVSIARPISKYCVSIDSPEQIVDILEEAIIQATTDRKGPSVINLPHDIQRSIIEVKESNNKSKLVSTLEIDNISSVVDILVKSERPLVLVGGGMRYSQSKSLLQKLLDISPIPVVSSLLGLDVVPHSHSCYRGVIGSYGNRGANLCIKYSDCILVLGSRIDDRQLSSLDAQSIKGKTIIHVDVDDAELGKKIEESIKIKAPVNAVLESLLQNDIVCKSEEWFTETAKMCDVFKSWDINEHHPNTFLHEFSMSEHSVFTFDVGNNQMHSAQSVFVCEGSRTLSSGGLGSMGYSLPAAIGACYANRNQKVYCITGDGGFQMNLQELQTISLNRLPVNVIVLNNNALGMIYHLQKKMFPGRYFATIEGYHSPCLEKLADSYGFKYCKVENRNDYDAAITLLHNKTMVLVEFVMNPDTKPIPDVSSSIFDQQPSLSKEEIVRIENILLK